ncbi:hypothetical protein OG233_22370 [Streptomyces sp. NBC_01218]|uniref:hypothetical protein n=1 Tax=Streptomyces sp. NBC_01218 TaxID=2903780 RepID=UPI002E11D04F|nr:hypothetical protein OG233_22370 [Streptomyces sp. NBC_01218]
MTRIDPTKYTAKAADAIRLFNHRTMPTQTGPGIAHPGTIYRAIGDVQTLSRSLQQALDHIGMALRDLNDAGLLTADHGTTDDHTATAVAALEAAEQAGHLMTEALGRAHTATSPLGYGGPHADTDDDL